MEYCGGPTLDRFTSKRNMNEAAVRSLFSQFGNNFSQSITFLFFFRINFPTHQTIIQSFNTNMIITAAGLKYMWTKNIIHRYLFG